MRRGTDQKSRTAESSMIRPGVAVRRLVGFALALTMSLASWGAAVHAVADEAAQSASASSVSAEESGIAPIAYDSTHSSVEISDAATQSSAVTHSAQAPIDYWSMLLVFVLATFIGIGVIGRVSRLLHTPLMSLTNAISAIAVVGSIVVTGADFPLEIRMLGAVALFASMTNIVSGFLITDRMLRMFKQKREGASE